MQKSIINRQKPGKNHWVSRTTNRIAFTGHSSFSQNVFKFMLSFLLSLNWDIYRYFLDKNLAGTCGVELKSNNFQTCYESVRVLNFIQSLTCSIKDLL